MFLAVCVKAWWDKNCPAVKEFAILAFDKNVKTLVNKWFTLFK